MNELDSFYKVYIQKLIKNDESLVLLFHISPNFDVKYNLLRVFEDLLRTLPYDFLIQNKVENSSSLAVQVSLKDFKFISKLYFHILFRNTQKP